MDTAFPILTLVSLAVTLWAAWMFKKRGQDRRAFWTAISSVLFLIGPVIAIIGLSRGAPEPVALDEPCEGCGGQEGTVTEGIFDRESGDRLPHVAIAVISGIVGTAIIVGAVALAISIWAGGDKSCSGGFCLEWENGAVVAGLAFLVMGGSLGLWVASFALKYVSADRVAGRRYGCAGCGGEWTRLATA